MGGALRASIQRLEEPLVTAVAAALLLLAVLPLAILSLELFDGGITASLEATLGSARPWTLLAETLALGLAITALALALGVPLGALLGSTDVAGRRAAFLLHAFPLTLPPFLIALGWFHIFGRAGPLGSELTSTLLFSRAGMVATLGLGFSPVVTGLTALGIRGIDPSLEEAARMVAGPRRVMTRILLPLARAPIALAALIVLSLSVSEIGAPMFLRVRTYPGAVFSRLGGMRYAPGEAFALVLPLLAVTLGLLLLERRLIGQRAFASLGVRSSEARVLRLGRARAPVSGVVWLGCAASVAPLVALGVRAGPDGFVALGQWLRMSLVTSGVVSALAATVITALGVVLGTRLARGRRWSGPLDAAAMLTFVTPGAVLGVGVVATWNRPSTHLVYGSIAILVVGLVARYAAIGVRAVAAVVSRSSPSLEEAAATFGGGYSRRMWQILLPMHARGITAAWLLAMVFCLRDIETVIVFYPPGRETLPVRLFTLEANGPEEVVAALALTHVGLTAAVLALGGLLLHKMRRT